MQIMIHAFHHHQHQHAIIVIFINVYKIDFNHPGLVELAMPPLLTQAEQLTALQRYPSTVQHDLIIIIIVIVSILILILSSAMYVYQPLLNMTTE